MCVLNDQCTINGQRNNTDSIITRALLAWIEISHTEFELELESKLKIIISIDENDSLAAIYFKTGGRGGTGSIKVRMQVSSLK